MESQEYPVSKAKVHLERKTSEVNSRVLDGIRGIIANQVELIKRDSSERMSPAEADVLLKLCRTYQIMDVSTDKEHAKYDFSQFSVEELKKLADSR